MDDKKEKLLIAMSGGVDSSVAAYLMTAAGHTCLGGTMRLFENEDAGISTEKSCCSLSDVEDARAVANRLSMPYYVMNFKADFRREVIDRFVETYERGGTPNPCIACNRYLKFDALLKKAEMLDCDAVVTGHYARIIYKDGRYLLMKAKNPAKDQSYVLYSLTQYQLAHTRFPLGDYSKEEIRAIAEEQGFINAKKHDSQDICFVPDGDYAAAICRFSGKTYPEGEFVNLNGEHMGTHKGIIHYTIGQRKGLGLALPAPHYVCRKDVVNNKVILGHNEDLFSCHLEAEDVNWIAFDEPPKEFRAKARIRYQQAEQWATIRPIGKDRLELDFDEPQRAIASGQAVVLYDGDLVIGGGVII